MKKLIIGVLALMLVTTCHAGPIQRLEQAGVSFTESLSSISDIEKRFAITGDPISTDTPWGKGMAFDGNDSITVTDSVKGFLDYSTNVTVSVRCNFEDTSANIGFFGSNIASNVGPIRCGLVYSAGSYYARFELVGNSGNSAMTGSIVLLPNTDYTLTYQKEGNNFKIFVNGVVDSDTDYAFGTLKAILTNEYMIGFAGYYYMTGNLKDIVVEDRAWTPTEILDFAQGTTFDYDKDLVSEWDMSSLNPVDIGWKDNGNDGTSVNMDSTNIRDGATYFNGSDEYINCGNDSSLNFGDGTNDSPFSIAFRINIPSTVSASGEIISKYDSASASLREWTLELEPDKDIPFFLADSVNSVSAYCGKLQAVSTGWHDVVITYDGSGGANAYLGVDMYLDGVESKTGGGTSASYVAMSNTSVNAIIGARMTGAGHSRYLDGELDQVQIYNKALTNLEVSDLYAKGNK